MFIIQQILYSRIAVTLWKSSRGLERHMAMQSNACSSSASAMTSNFIRNASKKYEKRAVGVTDSQVNTYKYFFVYLYLFLNFCNK